MSPYILLAAQSGAGPSLLLQFAPLAVIFAIFYFVAIAPMRKRQQALQQTIAALKKGDKVVTNGGLYGEVAGVDSSTVIVKIADGVKVRVAKSAVAGLQDKSDKSDKTDKTGKS